MVHTRSLITALLVATVPAVYAGKIQKDGLTLPPSASANRDAVKAIFVNSYEAYKKSAWGHDDLAPLPGSNPPFVDSRNGWGASIVDGMDTMHIMGLTDYFNEAVTFASNIDFSKSNTSDTVSVFESTIRYIGGLLSAYELGGKQQGALVEKARQLADKLILAWVGGNTIPFGRVDFSNNKPVIQNSNIAEAGTLILEWATLSKYTGNSTYFKFAEKAMRQIATNPAPLPGLAPQGINPNSGAPVGGYLTWGGGSDSYFEYLIKFARLNNTNDALYADTWKLAVDSSLHSLLKKSTVGGQTYLADINTEKQVVHVSSHLACFHGGNWLMGGSMTNNKTVIDTALELVDSCWNTYESTATGIGPETFAFMSDDGNSTGGPNPTPEQLEFYQQHGFYIQSADYILRPEVMESNFYAWRSTGDSKYLDRASKVIQSINNYLLVKASNAYTGIMDVNNANSAKINDMESFWFAETLKYLYLTFDDPSHISLDNYVFNTEAHPFEAPASLDNYGTPGGPVTSQNPPKFSATQAPVPNFSQSPGLPGDLHIPESGIFNLFGRRA
ncbi:hypothetical protein D9756_006500 [Leucocoprinus leucothites]|uniref:alpha-1,2-Mannosidase n=1 Tax=Leucocoprinus leucothites TaxID=201217 RepID=A0A8H5LH38_9AGAR|nr:hypothetical protein D9756_006500 [Leucoagaricus leucothites]